MDSNIEIINKETIENDLAKFDKLEVKQLCKKCKQRKTEDQFFRNGKVNKTCNMCSEKYSKKKEENIVVADPKIDPVIETIGEDSVKNALLSVPLTKINDLEKLCALPMSSQEEWDIKTDIDKINYNKMLISQLEKIYSRKFNPGTWTLLASAKVVEINAPLIGKSIGYDICLDGFQKELAQNKDDIDQVMLELMQTYPEALKYLANPMTKLALIVGSAGMNCHSRNMLKNEGRPKKTDDV